MFDKLKQQRYSEYRKFEKHKSNPEGDGNAEENHETGTRAGPADGRALRRSAVPRPPGSLKAEGEEEIAAEVQQDADHQRNVYNRIEKALNDFIQTENTAQGWIDTFKPVTSKYSKATPVENVLGGIFHGRDKFFSDDLQINIDAAEMIQEAV